MGHLRMVWKRLGLVLSALPFFLFPFSEAHAHGSHGGGGGHHSGGGPHHTSSHPSGQHHEGSHHEGEQHKNDGHHQQHPDAEHHNDHHHDYHHNDYHHNDFNRNDFHPGYRGGVGPNGEAIVPIEGNNDGDNGYQYPYDPNAEEDALYNADVQQSRAQPSTPSVNVNVEGGQTGK